MLSYARCSDICDHVRFLVWSTRADYRYYERSIGIEIKPVVGDDYRAVLRQMKANGSTVLFLERYTGKGCDARAVHQDIRHSASPRDLQGRRLMILDLNFYPEKQVETLKALPEIVLDCDLTGWTFHDLVRCLTTPSSCFGMGCTTSMRMARFAGAISRSIRGSRRPGPRLDPTSQSAAKGVPHELTGRWAD